MVIKDENSCPQELIDCNENLKSDYLKNKINHKIDDNCYGHRAVRKKLKEIYNRKCAYCDSEVGGTLYPHIEHYRPKSIYYWLAYEWDNLLFSCQVCNVSKGKKFPREENIKVFYDMDLSSEEPLILNPEKDDLREFYEFDINGKIYAKGDNSKAKKTIEICKLYRDDLIEDRKDKINDVIQILTLLIKDETKEDEIKSKFEILFESMRDSKSEFSIMFNYFLLNFDEIFKELYLKYLKA